MPETFHFTGGASVSVDDIIKLINEKGHSHLLPLHVNSPNFPLAIERLLLVVQEIKIKGNEHFKRKDFQVAIVDYDRAADVIKWLSKEWVNAKCNPENKPTLLEKVKAVQKAMAQCYNNTAIALSKMKRHAEVIEVTTKVLDIHPQNEKALFRRAEAALAKQDFAMSLADIRNYGSIVTNLNAEAKNIRSLAKKGLKMQAKMGPRDEDAPPVLVKDASSSDDTSSSSSEDPDFMDDDEYSSDGSGGPPPLKGLKGAKGKGKGKGKKSGSASSKPPALMDGRDGHTSKKKKVDTEKNVAAAAGAKPTKGGRNAGLAGFPGNLTPNLEQLMKSFTNQSARSGMPIEEYLMNLTAEEQKHIWSLVGGSGGPPTMRQDSDSSDGEMPPLKAAAPEGKRDKDDGMPPLTKDKGAKKSSPKAADDEASASTSVVEAPREKRKKGEKKKKVPSLVMADSDSSSSYAALSDSGSDGDEPVHAAKAISAKTSKSDKISKSEKGRGGGMKSDQVYELAKAQAAKEVALKAEKERQAIQAARMAAAEAQKKEESERIMRELLLEEERERKKKDAAEASKRDAEMKAQKEKEKKEEKKKKKEMEAAQKKAEEEERKAQQARIRAETEKVKREREKAAMEEAERMRAEQLRQEAEAKKMEEAERQQKEEAMLEEAREMMMALSLAGEKGGKQLTESKMKDVRKMRKKIKKLEHECEEGINCVRLECWFVHPNGRQIDLQKRLEEMTEAANAAKAKEAAAASKKTAAAGGAKEAGMDLKSERESECDAGRQCIDAQCPRKHSKGREMDDEAEARRLQEEERMFFESRYGDIMDDAPAAGAAPAAGSSIPDVVTAGGPDQVTAGGPAKTAGEEKDEEEVEWEINEMNECSQCLVYPKEYCFNPCGHLQACTLCWKECCKVARTGRRNHKDVAKTDTSYMLRCWICEAETPDDVKERMIHKHEAIKRGIKVHECD